MVSVADSRTAEWEGLAKASNPGNRFRRQKSSDGGLPELGVPVLCHRSHTGQLKFAEFLRIVGATSVRAGCRQVIEVLAIVIENVFRPDNGP